MNPLEIIIPLIWAGGLVGIAALFPRRDGRFPIENFFPAAGALGLLIYLFGLLDFWSGALFVIISIILAGCFIWACLRTPLLRGVGDFVRAHSLFSTAFAVAMAWFGLASLSYPVSADALYTHLGMPKIYAEAGRMFFTPGILFSAGPRALEMITTGFYFLGLERGPQIFVVLIAAALMLAIYLRAADFGARGIYAVLIFASVPIVMSQVVATKNDFLLWGLSFFACLKFIEFQQTGKAASLVWSAVGVGLAAGTKAVGLGVFGALAIILIFEVMLGKITFRRLIYFLAVAIAVLSPWYVYSWVVTGNPVYPFFDDIFHSPLTNAAFERFNAALAVERVPANIVNFLVSPIRLVFDPEPYDGRLGYALLLFPFLLIFLPRIPHKVRIGIALSIAFYVIWFFGFAFARFLLPVGPLLAIAGAYFITRAEELSKPLKWAAIVSLFIAIMLPIPGVIRDSAPRALAALAGTPKYEFLRRFRALDPFRTQSAETVPAMPYMECWRFINEITPRDSRIGILTSFVTRADGYYLDREYVYLNPSEQVQYEFVRLRNGEEISRALMTLGITHVVIDSVVATQFGPGSEWSAVPGFGQFSDGVAALVAHCNNNGELLYQDMRFRLYRL